MLSIFKSTRNVIKQLDDFFDAIDQSSLLFSEGVANFLSGKQERFSDNLEKVKSLEHDADNLRRSIENDLYSHSLMPEYRSDVLRLLDKMDELIDRSKENLMRFDIEHPEFPEKMHDEFKELAEASSKSIAALVIGTRQYFNEIKKVKDQLHRVYFYERKADDLADNLKRQLFSDATMDLAQKQHLRYFIEHTEKLSDRAELVADMVSIYAIKRSV